MQIIASQSRNGSENQVERIQIIKVSLNKCEEIFDHIIEQSTITKGSIDYMGSIGYTKQLTLIVFPGEQVFYIYYSRTKTLKNYRNV